MAVKNLKIFLLVLVVATICPVSFGQETVPFGIHYQAVARDNDGKELTNKNIDIRFSIISENPQGTLVYQELHSKVITSKYGVFSLVIGHGTPTGGIYDELSLVNWPLADHYLKVEVKFENDFMDMGTMQFLTVPYALYAQKSLEPGPPGPTGEPGPKGEPGDPASDDQTISFDQSILTINRGNSVPLTSLLQNLTITNSPEGNYLGISRGNSVLLATIEADGDPKNELQDLSINSDKLKITNNVLATEWDLTRYLDNTDNQTLVYDPVTRKMGIQNNSTLIDLTELENDADSDPLNEIQNLEFDQSSNTLSISSGNSVVLGNMVAFRAEKINPAGPTGPEITLICDVIRYNDGTAYNNSTGEFVAPIDGVYTFNVRYDAEFGGKISIFLNGQLFEKIAEAIPSNGAVFRSITMKLSTTNIVKVVVSTGLIQTGTGSFSGFRVY